MTKGEAKALPVVEMSMVLTGCQADCAYRLPDEVESKIVVLGIGFLNDNGDFMTRYESQRIHQVCGLSEAEQKKLAARRQNIYTRAFAARDEAFIGPDTLNTRMKKASTAFRAIADEYTEGICPAYERP